MNRAIRTVDSLIAQTMSTDSPPRVVEPLSLADVKRHLKFAPTSEDDLLEAWISAARQHFEEQTGRQLITATWEYWLDELPAGPIELPHPPLQSVVSVSYMDSSGSLVDFTEGTSPPEPLYSVNAPQGPYCSRGRIAPNFGTLWPTPQATVGAVRIQYVAGYGDTPDDVPVLARQALYLLVGHFHKFRAEVVDGKNPVAIPMGAAKIIEAFKYSALPQLGPPSVDDMTSPTWITWPA